MQETIPIKEKLVEVTDENENNKFLKLKEMN